MNLIENEPSIKVEPQETAPEELLVLAVQTGSKEAFAELQRLYSQRLYRTIALITKNQEDAEDALQETFLRAYLAVRHFERRSSVYSWLTRIAINCALMVLRKRRSRAALTFESFDHDSDVLSSAEIRDHAPDPEQVYLQRQRYQHLSTAIQRLEPKLRRPMEILLARECTMKELAETLDISVAAAKARLYRARRRLAAAHELKSVTGKTHLSATHTVERRPSGAGIEGYDLRARTIRPANGKVCRSSRPKHNDDAAGTIRIHASRDDSCGLGPKELPDGSLA